MVTATFILPLKTYAQKEILTTVVYKYVKDSYMRDSFAFDIHKPLELYSFETSYNFPKKIMSFTTMGDTCITKCQYTIKDTTCAILADLFGHEVIVIPGDNYVVNVGARNKDKLVGKYIKNGLMI